MNLKQILKDINSNSNNITKKWEEMSGIMFDVVHEMYGLTHTFFDFFLLM